VARSGRINSSSKGEFMTDKEMIQDKYEIPPRIAYNIINLLQRVKCEGAECLAWAEAHAFLTPYAAQMPQPTRGVPFESGAEPA
jgi:hypothetical protein